MLDNKGQPKQEAARRITVLLFPGIVALDLVGPIEAFHYATVLSDQLAYSFDFVASDTGPITAASSAQFVANHSIKDYCRQSDILLIPGMMNPDDEAYRSDAILEWVRAQCERSQRLACVCSGVFVLAEAGVVSNETVTTHWNDSPALKHRFPSLDVQDDRIFARAGSLYTSGGVTAGIDLALAIIAEDGGPALAASVAKRMLVYMQRQGDQKQFSDLLNIQTRDDRFAHLISRIEDELSGHITVERLSEWCNMSPRNFSRAFKQSMGISPMAYVRSRRLLAARQLLEQPDVPIGEVGHLCGFSQHEQFSRAFKLAYDMSPNSYRSRFKSPSQRGG